MNTEEKILAILSQLQEEQKQMRDDLSHIKSRLGDMESVQTKMQAVQTKMQAVQTKMQDDLTHIKSRLGDVESVQIKMQDDLTHVKARLDLDVEKRLDVINEGIDAIRETVVPKSRVERLEDDVIVLKAAVKTLTQEVSELKKAQ